MDDSNPCLEGSTTSPEFPDKSHPCNAQAFAYVRNTILVNVVDFQDNPNSKRYFTNKMQGGDASRALADAKIDKIVGM